MKVLTYLIFALVLLMPVSTKVASAATAIAVPGCNSTQGFYEYNFGPRPTITNKWFPLRPGTQFVFSGTADRGGGTSTHRVVFTVTDLTKVVSGVRTLVVWDIDINQGQVVEAELSFFAQDNNGNVWNFGEYPEEFADQTFLGAPNTWFAGVDGAEAGVHMLAAPELLTSGQVQGWAPDIAFLDCVRTVRVSGSALVTDEWDAFDFEGPHQLKYYQAGVGLVRIDPVDDPEGETLVLTEVKTLTQAELLAARAEALKLEQRAYIISSKYRQTPPATP